MYENKTSSYLKINSLIARKTLHEGRTEYKPTFTIKV